MDATNADVKNRDAGTSAARNSAAKCPTTPRRGWFKRNWKWLIPTIVLAPALAGGGFLYWKSSTIKGSAPYKSALAAAQSSPQVTVKLGTPIEGASWLPQGAVNVQNDRGEAILNFQIKGPNGAADVSTQARMVGGEWGGGVHRAPPIKPRMSGDCSPASIQARTPAGCKPR